MDVLPRCCSLTAPIIGWQVHRSAKYQEKFTKIHLCIVKLRVCAGLSIIPRLCGKRKEEEVVVSSCVVPKANRAGVEREKKV